jgi:D-glucosaminate-6-phosphate ammonia-lyase
MKVPGISKEFRQPEDLSNHAPTLQLSWDPAKLGITGTQVEALLLNGTPRIVVAGSSANTLRIMPYMMQPGDHKIAAEAIHRVLANPPKSPAAEILPPAADVAGSWTVTLNFLSGSATHQLTLQQTAGKVVGTHKGETISGNVTGSVEGKTVKMRSSQKIQGTSLAFTFTGTMEGDSLRGTVQLGEYGKAISPRARHDAKSQGRTPSQPARWPRSPRTPQRVGRRERACHRI